ncbi:MAG: hypothetical protein WBC96_03125 [Thermodesulfobacteriota bacterium]
MVRLITTHLLIALTLSAFTVLNPVFSEDQDKTELFTKDEAKVLRYNDDEWKKEVLPTNPPDTIDHPSILFEDPKVTNTDKGPTIVVIEPTSVLITIKQNDSPLDPGTLKVWGEKFFVHIDVTDRVLKYFKITKEGAVLKADSIHIPHGHYKVGMSIADVNGNKTEKKYRLKVE